MNRILAGIVVDEELYEKLVARRYDVSPDWRNVPLETVEIAADSKDYAKYPEWQKKCREIVEQVKAEIKKYYSAKDGRKEYKTMRHQDFTGYVDDLRKIQEDMGNKAQSLCGTVEKARETWKRVTNDKSISELGRAEWKATYLRAEEDFKTAIADLHTEMNEALDKVQEQLQEHLDDFYGPNGSRIDDTTMKLLNAEFPFNEAEFDRLAGRYTDNPTMLRILDQYARAHELSSRMVVTLSYYAKQRGQKEMDYFKGLRELALMAIRDKGVIPSYQARFDEMVEKTIASLKAIPVRPM
ncbi:hypothetical protein [Lachnoclostridium sp. An138]|uniref:hypothetical protein n=1 Tax=Lachnoclostridium sp. An138 TaxID=1965560 RepID=UPI000B3A056C|nr:hypothetical protein [Lachnoclostridium sp. An138]OUQ14918.1 hypothetical protein B5E82_16520 [Lachnoclostridium sp. An138]